MHYIKGRQDKPVREVLDKGEYKGYKYLIFSFGTHPCAYVQIPKIHPYWNFKDYDELPIEVHGGLTFAGEQPYMDNNFCIGWDYYHFDDYNPLSPELGGKRWHTVDILKDVFDVIHQLCKHSMDAPPIKCPICGKPMSEGDKHFTWGGIRKVEIWLGCGCGCEFIYRRADFAPTSDEKEILMPK